MASSTLASSASSITATEPAIDIESRSFKSRNTSSYFSVVFDSVGLNNEVLHYQYPGDGTAQSPYLVDFLPEDPRNPMTFAQWKKWLITLLQALATLAVAFVSTAYSGGVFSVMSDFGVSTIVAILGVSLFVLGFAIGPLFWGPLSEMYGRRNLFFISYLALTAFTAGGAGANNIATLIVLRFLAGAFGSSPMTNAGGVIADLFTAAERGLATAVFAAAPFLGPSIGMWI
jgi:hypothetical protein